MKLAAVGAMAAGLVGAGASAALASGDYTDITATEAAQCISSETAVGAGLLIGLGANIDALNSESCTGSVNVNEN